MVPVNPSEMPSLDFNIKEGETSKKMRLSANKIGWIHSLAARANDQAGVEFDLTIKDALGRIKLERHCSNETDRHGELVNLESYLGEEVEVVIENTKNVDQLKVALN